MFSRRISAVAFGGASAEFVNERLRETTLQLQQEQERLAYIGKLEQALNKDKGKDEDMCLLYADIDGLRATTRHTFVEHKRQGNRRPEIEIRNEIRSRLAVCLEDAFFDLTGQDAKIDLFELGEPDIIIMVRGTGREPAKAFAQEGKRNFHDETNSHVTIALLCINEVPNEYRNASKLDEEAERRLNIAKDQHRGTVWP